MSPIRVCTLVIATSGSRCGQGVEAPSITSVPTAGESSASTDDSPTEVAASPEPTELQSAYAAVRRFLEWPDPVEPVMSMQEATILSNYLGPDVLDHWKEAEFSRESIRHTWLVKMAQLAGEGTTHRLRMPLYTNVGWGCEVPSIWVASGNFDEEVTFIAPRGAQPALARCEACFDVDDDEARLECEARHCSLEVTGQFTGETVSAGEECPGPAYAFQIEDAKPTPEPRCELLTDAPPTSK
jgi:hypothetical protein